jgi:hypothetical protein
MGDLFGFEMAVYMAAVNGRFVCRDSAPEWKMMGVDGGLFVRRINMRDPAENRPLTGADLKATDWRLS